MNLIMIRAGILRTGVADRFLSGVCAIVVALLLGAAEGAEGARAGGDESR